MELLRFTDPLTHHDNAPEEKKAIPEDQRMNPECPCRTRGCEYHGFCKLCVAKHQRPAAKRPASFRHRRLRP